MLQPRPLAITDFKKFGKKLCVWFSSLVLLLLLYFSPGLLPTAVLRMADFISVLHEISQN